MQMDGSGDLCACVGVRAIAVITRSYRQRSDLQNCRSGSSVGAGA